MPIHLYLAIGYTGFCGVFFPDLVAGKIFRQVEAGVIIAVDARPLMNRQISGTEQHARNIVAQWAAMAQRGESLAAHQFLLLCDKGQLANSEIFDTTFIDALPAAQFRRIAVRDFHLLPRFFIGVRILHALSRLLAREQVQVYHSFTPLVPRTSVCPVIQTIHDLSCELDSTVRQRPENRQLRRLTRLGATRAQRIIAVSSQTKNDIESIFQVPSERIAVVYNGINPVFVPTSDADMRFQLRQRYNLAGPFILAVGSDIPRRNYARLLEAMKILWLSEPHVRLVVTGRNDWLLSPLFQRVQAAGVTDKITFIQAPTDPELAELYRMATLTCCASSFEGFGMSVLESMACGTPVTCSDMRSLREVADEAAVYFPHDDAAIMGESLLGLLEDVEYRRQLKYRGLSRATLFTWETAARLIWDALEQVAAG